MDAEIQFIVRLSKIEGRTLALRKNLEYTSARILEREANTCHAELELLYEYAIQHEINIRNHYVKLTEMKSELCSIQSEIESRKGSIWRKIIGFIEHAVEIVFDFLGLGSFVRLLRGTSGGVKGFLREYNDED